MDSLGFGILDYFLSGGSNVYPVPNTFIRSGFQTSSISSSPT